LCAVTALWALSWRSNDSERYARDIVERCETLIESFLPVVIQDPAKRFGGPLGTTFLVAMSTPMILLPIERMLKPAANRDSVADDRTVDESLGKAVTETLSAKAAFGGTPFGRAGAWSYVDGQKPFNLAGGIPGDLLERLSKTESSKAALNAKAVRVLTDLRNALAHGDIAYLDERGRQTDVQAAMLAFVGAVMKGGRITGVNVLRIGECDYRQFWAAWGIVAPPSGGHCCLERTSPKTDP
jgi:hypothetical protein